MALFVRKKEKKMTIKLMAVGLFCAASLFAAEVQVVKITVLPFMVGVIPGFLGEIQVFVTPAAGVRSVRVTVQTLAGPMSAQTAVWEGYATMVWFPVADIQGVPVVEEMR